MIGMKRPKNRVAAKGNFILEIYIHLQCMYISKIKRREFMNENYAIEYMIYTKILMAEKRFANGI